MSNAKIRRVDVGTFVFGDTLDITDPCYNRDVWCRINEFPCLPGKYSCVAFISDEGEWGDRVARIGIYHDGKNHVCNRYIGEIGVDSGMAGFFDEKPDYTRDEWTDLCDMVSAEVGLRVDSAFITNDGFFSHSGYGDGGYPVMARLDKERRLVAAEIRFI